VDMVRPGEAAQREQQDEEEGRRREADDDRGQYEGLRHRVGMLREISGDAALEHGQSAGAKAAGGEDEDVDGVGEERQPDDHLEGARTEQQPDAGAREHAYAERDDELHQSSPAAAPTATRGGGAVASRAGVARRPRTDWWASAISMRTVAPNTKAKTPMSKRRALAVGTSPMSGSRWYPKYDVRNG